ncbi:hypothetical protein APHAL10511_004081 [Amanita phalloides]|nr:hypothetical protein APHAL10511_004081 [Amanita phalloides]
MGRITVPPAVVMAANGLTDNGPGTASAYSRENPPPSFIQAKTLMSKPCGGSTKQLREFLKGGWRHVPAEQRWWEDALGGCVEVTRKARLDAMEELRRGLEGARS